MSKPPVTPRPAATVIIARDTREGMEVFMMRRSQQMVFVGGHYVFPGGGLDKSDSDPRWATLADSFSDAEASRILGVPQGGLAYWVAALRECFEESGLLLCHDERGELVTHDEAEFTGELAGLRARLIAGEISFADLLQARALRPALEHVAYLSHWITPHGNPRRFDTRFLITAVPLQQTASHDDGEADHHLWLRPDDALERHRNKEIQMIFPTIKTLEMLSQFPDTAALMSFARAPRHIPVILPRRAIGRDGERMIRPGDPPYAEIAKIDPNGAGKASYEIIPGVTTRLAPRVRRITAPNPGFMTGPGTNSYLIGDGDDIAVIDPGPPIEAHIQALLDEARGADGKGRIRWVLTTHTHMDHSPGAAMLKAHTGAELIGLPPPVHGNQDRDFKPDRVPPSDERLAIAGCTLRILHTPGHASNQACYLLEEEKLLFTGDHVMQGSTVVISPPDGDMIIYLESLRAVQTAEADWIAPGHGFLIAEPGKSIERIIAHRLQREAKVLDALQALGGGTLDELVVRVYDDVPAKVHPVASRSLHAHLLKLQADGRATKTGERWSL